MADKTNTLHKDDLEMSAYDTSNTFGQDKNPKQKMRLGATSCPQENFDPRWCRQKGCLVAAAPNGVMYPLRAFGPAGPFSPADLEAAIAAKKFGVELHGYDGGTIDGREMKVCHSLPSCMACYTFAICGMFELTLKEAGAHLCGQSFKPCADPAFAGTSLEGNFGDKLVEPADDADPLAVAVNEESTVKWALDWDTGEYVDAGYKQGTVCALVGKGLK